jgi:hypothetical protein
MRLEDPFFAQWIRRFVSLKRKTQFRAANVAGNTSHNGRNEARFS